MVECSGFPGPCKQILPFKSFQTHKSAPEGYSCYEVLQENEEVVTDEVLQCDIQEEDQCYSSFETAFTSYQVLIFLFSSFFKNKF